MAKRGSASGGVVERVARIVGSYVRHHQIEPGQLVRLIGEVHRALGSLGQSAPSVPELRPPAVPIQQSVRARVCDVPRVRVSLENVAPTSAGTARARRRRISCPLEFAIRSGSAAAQVWVRVGDGGLIAP